MLHMIEHTMDIPNKYHANNNNNASRAYNHTRLGTHGRLTNATLRGIRAEMACRVPRTYNLWYYPGGIIVSFPLLILGNHLVLAPQSFFLLVAIAKGRLVGLDEKLEPDGTWKLRASKCFQLTSSNNLKLTWNGPPKNFVSGYNSVRSLLIRLWHSYQLSLY